MVRLHISLDDQLIRRARIQAAEEGTSAPRLIASILRNELVRQREYEQAMKRWLAAEPGRDSDDDQEK